MRKRFKLSDEHKVRVACTVVLTVLVMLCITGNVRLQRSCTSTAVATVTATEVKDMRGTVWKDKTRYNVVYTARVNSDKQISVRKTYSDTGYPDTINIRYNPSYPSEYLIVKMED